MSTAEETRHPAVSVAIIGAGLAGVATAVKLTLAGFDDFTVFEQAAGVGGTWYDNIYPGAEVDVNSFFYSFSFMDHNWSRTHATQPEIAEYINRTVDHFDIRRHLSLSTRVEAVIWDDARRLHQVTLANGDTRDFRVVVSCVGLLNNPRYPTWPGLDDFEGPKFHTSRWEREHDLTGKTIAVVGTGSTSAQIVPAIAPIVDHLYLFQREPGWVLPKNERDFTPAEQALYAHSPLRKKYERYKEYRVFANSLGLFANDSRKQREVRRTALDFIAAEIPDPVLRDAVTPRYPPGCKRLVLASTYYAALNRPNVTLVPHAVERVTRGGLIAADGVEREVDVLVMATGFQAQNFLARLRVTGSGGRRLHDVWGDAPQALLGSMVPGFPNFFMLYGPNTNGGGSIIFQLECQADLVVRQVKRLRGNPALSVDTREHVFTWYNRWIQDQLAKHYDSARPEFCNNYYFSPSGRNVTQWPGSNARFRAISWLLPLLATVTRP